MKQPTMTAITLAAALAAACGDPSHDPTGIAPSFDRDDDGGGGGEWSPWSEPVNLGLAVNGPDNDQNPGLSPDELQLYFVSTRPGGLGGTDIWVSQRRCLKCPWEMPVNLGAPVNSDAAEGAPSLSDDGRLLFFFSARPGGHGGADIYVSRRVHPDEDGDEDDDGDDDGDEGDDELVWGHPVNLGAHVNTAAGEAGAEYVPGAKHGLASLYFNRRSAPVATAPFDLYSVPLARHGLPREPAAPISELNTPANDQSPTLSTDGREVFLGSDRPGTLGGNDIWRSTRRSVHDPWSTPVNLGTPINTAFADQNPSLSGDGRTLMFASDRPGGLGSTDLWMSTRTLSGDDDDDDHDDGDGDYDGDDGDDG